jgi:NitT/TauT family transport system permease protein
MGSSLRGSPLFCIYYFISKIRVSILPIIYNIRGDEFARNADIIGHSRLSADIYLTVKKIPQEQITKSLLRASQFQTTYWYHYAQVIPRLIVQTRLSFGAAWLFLIAAEAIVSDSGSVTAYL